MGSEFHDRQRERLQKIKELALRGVGGEKEQAQALLEKLMEKYSVGYDELDEETVSEYILKYHGIEERNLLRQIIYKVTNDVDSILGVRNTETGRLYRTEMGARCTESQKVEIEMLFEFYKQLWEEEKMCFLNAFIQKHEIFGERKPGQASREFSDEEVKKMKEFMRGMSDKDMLKQITDGR